MHNYLDSSLLGGARPTSGGAGEPIEGPFGQGRLSTQRATAVVSEQRSALVLKNRLPIPGSQTTFPAANLSLLLVCFILIMFLFLGIFSSILTFVPYLLYILCSVFLKKNCDFCFVYVCSVLVYCHFLALIFVSVGCSCF